MHCDYFDYGCLDIISLRDKENHMKLCMENMNILVRFIHFPLGLTIIGGGGTRDEPLTSIFQWNHTTQQWRLSVFTAMKICGDKLIFFGGYQETTIMNRHFNTIPGFGTQSESASIGGRWFVCLWWIFSCAKKHFV